VEVLASSTGFSAIDSTTVHWESSRWPTAELAKRWGINFTAAEADFSLGRRLPSGDVTINGSTTRTRGDDVKSFAVETVTPLHFDATCDADDRITSGELNIVFVRAGNTTTVNIVWNGCGVDPTVTVTPPPPTTEGGQPGRRAGGQAGRRGVRRSRRSTFRMGNGLPSIS
jgi:hypothetical protein